MFKYCSVEMVNLLTCFKFHVNVRGIIKPPPIQVIVVVVTVHRSIRTVLHLQPQFYRRLVQRKSRDLEIFEYLHPEYPHSHSGQHSQRDSRCRVDYRGRGTGGCVKGH